MGQRPFAYTPPTGFKALNTANLPAATINNGAQYFAATTYTGTGAANVLTNGGNNTIGTTFQPDLVWAKSRSNAYDNGLEDSVRGVTKDLNSNNTDAEETRASSITAFNSNGFTLGGNDAVYNASAATYVGWQWKAGGNAASNTSGTITSSVSANTTAGFSIVTYTGTGSNATVGHGLGVAPSMIIAKQRSAVQSWPVYHTSIGAANVVYLDLTNASASSTAWQSTTPSSSVFSIGTSAATNTSSGTYVAYCFAAVAGYSAFGSYTGNSSSDGPFVYLGFRPRWVLLKVSSASGYGWLLYDSSRDTYNVTDLNLRPNLSDAESSQTANYLDFLSNGFKIRGTSDGSINPTQTVIYAAFAENPFNTARAR
jgi:hypothetical protein